MSDRLFQKDKAKHLAICAIAGAFHPIFAIGLAIGKEYADKVNGHWCWWDILADAIGTIIGGALWWLVWN